MTIAQNITCDTPFLIRRMFFASTGMRPPPCVSFSLTLIDIHRAVLIGGWRPDHSSNDPFILDLATMVRRSKNEVAHIYCSFLFVSGQNYHAMMKTLIICCGELVILRFVWTTVERDLKFL